MVSHRSLMHRSLMIIYFKNHDLGATVVHNKGSKQKSTNPRFFRYDCNPIRYQTGYMGQFVHIISNPLYWYYTEASWPFISKVGAFECMVHKLVSKQKSTNSSSFLNDCEQIHYQIGYMGQFVHIISNSIYFYYTEASWPFISKVMTWVQLWCINRQASQNRQIRGLSSLL